MADSSFSKRFAFIEFSHPALDPATNYGL